MGITLSGTVVRPSSVQTWCVSRPMTLFVRGYWDSGDAQSFRIMIQDAISGFSSDYRSWICSSSSWVQEKQGLTTRSAQANTGIIDPGWNNYFCQYTSATLRRARINNEAWVEDTNSSTPNLGTDTYVHVNLNGGGMSVADIACWTTQLSDDECANLTSGISPRFVSPANLRFYIPAIGSSQVHFTKEDWTVTGTGAVNYNDHPPIIGAIAS